jgi:hypothetical protein
VIADPDSLRALTHLSGHPDWGRLLAWIESQREREVDNLLRAHDPIRVHQLQGYCSALGDFLQTARSVQPPLSHLG